MQTKLFQFHTGAIKRYDIKTGGMAHYQFQFHTGAIKSTGLVREREGQDGFNSILVQLKGFIGGKRALSCPSFNSILVQLKAFGFCGCIVSLVRFQFHTGAIKRL